METEIITLYVICDEFLNYMMSFSLPQAQVRNSDKKVFDNLNICDIFYHFFPIQLKQFQGFSANSW
jgi:hypothetical protein